MSFSNLAVTTSCGTVIMAPAGTRTNSGAFTLPAITGSVSSAAYTVSGQAAGIYITGTPFSVTGNYN
jgi:hypothetical protein